MVECLNLTKPLGGARSLCTAFAVNFGTSVTRTLPGMWARLRPLGAVTWFLYGGERVFQTGESFAKLPMKVFFFFRCVGRIIPVGRNHFRLFVVTGPRGVGKRRSVGGWLFARRGVWQPRVTGAPLHLCVDRSRRHWWRFRRQWRKAPDSGQTSPSRGEWQPWASPL